MNEREQCVQHQAFEREIGRRLDVLDAQVSKVLEKMEQVIIQNTKLSSDISTLQKDFQDWKGGRKDLWSAVNTMRRLVYTGVGICVTLVAMVGVVALVLHIAGA